MLGVDAGPVWSINRAAVGRILGLPAAIEP